MGVETDPQNINALNAAWPANTEDVGEGDDHLRNIKQALQKNISGEDDRVALTASSGAELMAASAEGISSKAAGATQHLLKLLNSGAGVAMSVRSDGNLEFYVTDSDGALGAELGRAAPGGGWAFRYDDEDRLTIDLAGVGVATAGDVASQVSLRVGGTDRARFLTDPAGGHTLYLRNLESGAAVIVQRNGSENILLGNDAATRIYGPAGIEVLRIGASGEAAFLQGLTVADAPGAATDGRCVCIQ